MSYKDELKKSQGTGNNNPTLDIFMSFKTKGDEHDNPVFLYYDKEVKENKKFPKPITGILLGSAMQIEHYSDDLGTKGGSYRSDYYWSNDRITLFEPSAKGFKKAITGNIDEIATHIGDKPKKKMVLFVLTEKGIVAVATNLTIAIDQLKSMKDVVLDYMVVLTATKYNKDIATISGRAKTFLGKLVAKNPPNYAEILQGAKITDEIAEQFKIEEYAKNFNEWKKYKSTHKSESPDEVQQEEEHAEEHEPVPSRKPVSQSLESMPEDDLPF